MENWKKVSISDHDGLIFSMSTPCADVGQNYISSGRYSFKSLTPQDRDAYSQQSIIELEKMTAYIQSGSSSIYESYKTLVQTTRGMTKQFVKFAPRSRLQN